ncbi:hypothetical protein [Methylorubrum extorquens]|uniref:DNA transfer protein p32 n=1 Tax=Methylorubrum extorquens (strain ATCC 14718 / DSM 1338 / JCM 2805 / NCIMB 9133 / AM1) TaxID=272630 RepID=C5B181_METEA|nr:hypothetical protein [Methylorubrum extorquens]ACS41682.1 conserved hypothetical protein [Methylorubrum extorquens AM1]MCP1545305.1 hypothetical protein [Methylorubrum extorquens]MCP1587348.1 hypothetical protein [Methylorubrum extorquens]
MGAAAAIGLGSAASAGASLFGANSAANASKKAAQIAAATQMQMYNQTRTDLEPFRQVGEYAGGQLTNRLTELTSPIVMDQAALEATPGYRFTLNQGLKAGQNSAAARGLGLSGAAIKAATNYAAGLADQTYMNQFNVANTNQSNAFNRLLQATQLGQGAAAQTATAGTATGQGIANNMIQSGNAQAGAAMAGANAVGSAANNFGNYYAFAPILNQVLQNRLTNATGGGYLGNGS